MWGGMGAVGQALVSECGRESEGERGREGERRVREQ
jgi:hypothetical protein